MVAPLADLRLAAGYRLGQDRRVSNAVRQIAALASEATALDSALANKSRETEALRAINENYQHDLGTCQRDQDRLKASLSRVRGVNKALILAAGVLTSILILR